MLKEKELLEIERGDTAALTRFVEKYYPEILRYCRWHAPQPDMAEDAAQESFLKAVRYLSREAFHGNFRAFLYQIARNTCLDMRKSRWCETVSLDQMEEDPHDDSESICHAESRIDIGTALASLSDIDREIVQLRFGQDLKLKEIGEVLNLPLRTVQSKLRKAMKQMKAELEEK